MTTTENEPVWQIAGIGAMGSLLAGSFCQGGASVHLILKNELQLAAYQDTELTVISGKNVISCHPKAIDIDHFGKESIQYLLCCVKAFDITKLLTRLKHRLNEHSIIILVHNGLGVLEEIKAQLPQLRIILGISTIGAHLEEAFTVNAFLQGNIYLGSVIGQFTPNEVNTICSAFKAAKIPYLWEENIHSRMWEKFALNCSINILTALFNCKNGGLLFHNDTLKKMTHEVAQVISAYGLHLSDAELFLKVTQLIHITADNYSSMYNDVQNKKPTEIHYLNEHLIKLAQQKHIATPFNIKLLHQFYK